jgi:hypothetical protein
MVRHRLLVMGHQNAIILRGQFENLLVSQSTQPTFVRITEVNCRFPSPNADHDRSSKISVGLKPNCHDLTVWLCC